MNLYRPVSVAVSMGFSMACGGGEGAAPMEVAPPLITVTGVEDGAVIDDSVSIHVTVSAGTYVATVDGVPFFSGTTVREAGAHVLRVDAQDSGLTSQVTVAFEIRHVFRSVLIVRFFDLGDNDAGGGGDAILLSDSSAMGQQHVLVDAGPGHAGGRDATYVQRRLESLAIDTLQALILSHAHTDHFDGMPAVLSQTTVRLFVYNGQVRSLSQYNALLAQAAAQAEVVTRPDSPLVVLFGSAEPPSELRVLPPLPDFLADLGAGSSEINEGSLGAALTRGGFRIFFTGDGEVQANRRWRTDYPAETAEITVLKVGHHGANDAVFDNGSSGASAWLGHTEPDLHIISANGRSHPRVGALALLRGRTGVSTYCTSVHGDIELRVDPEGAWTVTVARNPDQVCVPGSNAST